MRREPDKTAAQIERQANPCTMGESRDGDLEQESPQNAGAPSRIRGGIWSVIGRAIGSFVGVASNGNDGHNDRSGSLPEGDGSEQDHMEHRTQRPPTDNELRAKMELSPSSTSGSKRTSGLASRFVGASGPGTLSNPPEIESPSTTEQATVNVPISLSPMQPPPDVLAVMKGRAAVGQRRPRFLSPPADVAAVLGKTREQRKHGRSRVHHRANLGEDGEGEGGNQGPTGDSTEYR